MNNLNKNNKEELQKNKLEVNYEVEGKPIKLTQKIVQDYLCAGNGSITIQEFKLFTELCQVRKLNPFLREAYIIKYSDKQPASIVVGKDAILKRAVLNPKYNGMESGIIIINSKGTIDERRGTFKLPQETLVGGWARVWRKDWEYPIYTSVSLDEVIQKKSDGTVNSNWTKQPSTMIEKVAKVRALRETFVEDLGGMYETEEMDVELPEINTEDPKSEEIPEANYEDVESKEGSGEPQEVDLNEL